MRLKNLKIAAMKFRVEVCGLALARDNTDLVLQLPPPGVTKEAWKTWLKYRFIACPKTNQTCVDTDCDIGAQCIRLRALGLHGDRTPMMHRERPRCIAVNRQGNPCSVRVEPGKTKCRFHGGKSTGPRTPEGRARVAEAQRRRWERYRIEKQSADFKKGNFLIP